MWVSTRCSVCYGTILWVNRNVLSRENVPNTCSITIESSVCMKNVEHLTREINTTISFSCSFLVELSLRSTGLSKPSVITLQRSTVLFANILQKLPQFHLSGELRPVCWHSNNNKERKRNS